MPKILPRFLSLFLFLPIPLLSASFYRTFRYFSEHHRTLSGLPFILPYPISICFIFIKIFYHSFRALSEAYRYPPTFSIYSNSTELPSIFLALHLFFDTYFLSIPFF